MKIVMVMLVVSGLVLSMSAAVFGIGALIATGDAEEFVIFLMSGFGGGSRSSRDIVYYSRAMRSGSKALGPQQFSNL